MKLSLILIASFVANLVLAFTLWLRPETPRAVSPYFLPGSATASTSNRSPDTTTLQTALVSGDAATLAEVGVPPEVGRALAVGRAFDKMQARMHELRPRADGTSKYWQRNQGMRSDAMTKEQRLELNKVRRDFADEMRAATGEDIESLFNVRDSRYGFLPAATATQLQQIERDYSEMESQALIEQEGIQLPSDREKLQLLRLEKERDIATALTPEQREQYELRHSRTANTVRGRYGDAIQSEEEYRRIFALQKAFDEQHLNLERDGWETGRQTAEAGRARREAEQQLQADIRAALNPESLVAWQHANDQDYKSATSLMRRLNLPANTPDLLLASRETYAAQSLQINANPTLSPEARRTQLQTLATQAENELQRTLGAEGAHAYAQKSQWLNLLKAGNAFSTNPKDATVGTRGIGQTVFRVQPPRAARRSAPDTVYRKQ